MVLAAALGALGAVASGVIGSFSSRSAIEQQQAYNSAINKQSYEYSRLLNEQMFDLNRRQGINNLGLDKNLTDYQYKLQRDSRQTSFQDTRRDLEAAGYNPLLALGVQSNALSPGLTTSGGSQGSAGFNAADSDAVINAMNSALSGYNTTRQVDQLTKQTDSNINSAKYTNDLNIALAEKTRSEARGQDINNLINDTYGMQKEAQILDNLKKDGVLSEHKVKEIKQNIAESITRSSLNSAKTEQVRSDTALNKQEYDTREPIRRFSKSHPVAYGASQLVGSGANSALGQLGHLFRRGSVTNFNIGR